MASDTLIAVERLGIYPTPIDRLEIEGATIYCKRDDRTSPLYGGNKVRKLERLLGEAIGRGVERIVTTGAVGSHHVLATALFAKKLGITVEAVLAPQPASEHVEEVARIDAKLGVVPYPVGSFTAVPLALARRLRPTLPPAYFIPPGGSSVTGTLGFVDAAEELADQIARGEVPRPRSIVVALGSGGTAAGLLVGLHRRGLLPETEVVGVQVVPPPLTSSTATLALALAVRRRLGGKIDRATIATLSRGLRVVHTQLGKGYGEPTAAGAEATEIAARNGVFLDPTYTAKAFAATLEIVRAGGEGPILYWHTLAAPGPFHALLADAPALELVDPRVRSLIRARELG